MYVVPKILTLFMYACADGPIVNDNALRTKNGRTENWGESIIREMRVKKWPALYKLSLPQAKK